MHKAGSWENYQQVIVKVELSPIGTSMRYIVTSLADFRTLDLREKGMFDWKISHQK
jgi:hypothetical protein